MKTKAATMTPYRNSNSQFVCETVHCFLLLHFLAPFLCEFLYSYCCRCCYCFIIFFHFKYMQKKLSHTHLHFLFDQLFSRYGDGDFCCDEKLFDSFILTEERTESYCDGKLFHFFFCSNCCHCHRYFHQLAWFAVCESTPVYVRNE